MALTSGPDDIPTSPVAFALRMSRPFRAWAAGAMLAVLVATAAGRLMTLRHQAPDRRRDRLRPGPGRRERDLALGPRLPRGLPGQRGGLADERLLRHALDHGGGGRGQPPPLRPPLRALGHLLQRPLRGRPRQQDRERRERHRAPHLAVALAVPPLDRRPRRRLEPHLSRPSLLRARPRGLDPRLRPRQRVLRVAAPQAQLPVRGGLVAAPRADGGQHVQHRHRPCRRARWSTRRATSASTSATSACPTCASGGGRSGCWSRTACSSPSSSCRMLGPRHAAHRERGHQRGLPGHGDHGGHGARAAHVLPRPEPDPGRELPRPGRARA